MKRACFLILFFVSMNQYAAWNYGVIHIFGDSHSAYSFTNKYSHTVPPTPPESDWPITYEKSFFNYRHGRELLSVPFHIQWISRTMHMIGKSGFNVLDFRKHGVKNGDIALLHFGGIDAYHGHIERTIQRQYMLGRDLNEIVETLAENFIETVVENQKLYDRLTVIIMAVLPPWIRKHNKDDFTQKISHISYEEFVVLANRKLNDALEHQCKINNLLYFNVNALFEDKRGIIRSELSDGQHHVKPSYNYLIKRSLIKLILENVHQN